MRNLLAIPAFAVLLAGCSSGPSTADTSGKPGAYHIRGDEFEACECDVICPCVFNKNATYDSCQGWLAWRIKEGSYEGTDLSGVLFAATLLKTPKNLTAGMGTWEGLIYVPETATEAQRKAVEAIMRKEIGPAFAKLDVKTAKLAATGAGDHWELSADGVGGFRITGVKGPSGEVTFVENAPSPIALPKFYFAKADSNTFSDAGVKWDFAGHAGGYGPFEMKSK